MRLARYILGIMLCVSLGLGMLHVLFPLPVAQLHPSLSTVVVDHKDEMLRAFLAPDEMWRIPVADADVSATLRDAIVTYEDRRFYRHPGVDPLAIGRALIVNIQARSVVQGGSTLTMQVARLMQPKSRTLGNKLIEAFRALQLEWTYSKAEILDFYFNLAPYGGNIVGVGAASRFYFDKDPSQLSLGEAALLAAIPNNPNRYRPDLHPVAARQAREKVLRLLHANNRITNEALTHALTEPLPRQRFDLPFTAPHLAVHAAHRSKNAARLVTTLDAKTQRLAEQMLQDHLQRWLLQGITNGAVVIIENETRAVRALVGSRAFFDTKNEGQVNGALAPRSPGSALKPFIYALAMDRGLIAPESQLYDIPVDYAGYRPQNYDRQYHGVVSAEQALIRSLNVPAVNLSAKLGPTDLYDFLKAGGISTLTEAADHYGLALILGGGEVNLLELTNLYAAFADKGQYRPYRLFESDPIREPKALLNPGVSYLITETLSQLKRPDLPAVWEWSVDMPKVAWKTGTSYGHRDAWSIGYTPRYTVGVWIGNFDGKGVPNLVGAEVAAPLLFNLFTALERHTNRSWFVQPPTLERRHICTLSGQPATPFCPSTRSALYVPGVTPHQPCTHHALILVDRNEGYRLCSHCKHGRPHRTQVVEKWPASIGSWLQANGYPIPQLPVHHPQCTRVAVGEPPVIRSPQPNTTYRLRTGIDPSYQQIRLEASVANDTETLYWFANGELLTSGPPSQPVFFTPSVGQHTLLCMDGEGRSSDVVITVE